MSLSVGTKNRLKTILSLTAVGIAISFGFDLVVSRAQNYNYTFVSFLASVYYGAAIGFFLSAFELLYVEGHHGVWLRRAQLALSISTTFVVYVGIFLVIKVVGLFVFGTYAQIKNGEFDFGASGWTNIQTLFDVESLRDISFALVAFTIVYFFIRMRRIVGGRVLTNILLGRYDPPVIEDRVFMFVDVADSTRLAEKLGDLRLQELISRFFFQIDEAILDYGGEAHRYVGDEVVVTWRRKME